MIHVYSWRKFIIDNHVTLSNDLFDQVVQDGTKARKGSRIKFQCHQYNKIVHVSVFD